MRSIAFLSQKGGSGKTTLAAHISVAAGEKVLLVDLDPQGSSLPGHKPGKQSSLSLRKPPQAILPEYSSSRTLRSQFSIPLHTLSLELTPSPDLLTSSSSLSGLRFWI